MYPADKGSSPLRCSRVMREKWEYLVKRIVIGSPAEENLLADWLNAAGEDGWQLVTHMNFIMILKRRKMD